MPFDHVYKARVDSAADNEYDSDSRIDVPLPPEEEMGLLALDEERPRSSYVERAGSLWINRRQSAAETLFSLTHPIRGCYVTL